ncbi:MAG: hypothetical protein EA343_16035 [Nodularia sp. (in: Bacteria)]|nr:MAG: hypothetical protein EA343_16035 [Nodularia sp. (in: cyanobacteria)]
MNRVFSWLQKMLLRQMIIVFMIGAAFFSFQIFNYGNNMMLAKADTVKTPEGIYYKGTPDNNASIRNDGQVNNAQKNLKETAENVREKLNLDQPTPRATKEFLDSVQNQVEDTVEPITGSQHGYYQQNRPETNKR